MAQDVLDELSKTKDSPIDQQIQSLESKIQSLETKVNEDRFITIGIFVILFDGYLFEHMSNWGGPIALLVLEFVILLVLARKLKIEDVTMLSDKIINAVGVRNRN